MIRKIKCKSVTSGSRAPDQQHILWGFCVRMVLWTNKSHVRNSAKISHVPCPDGTNNPLI